jgi:hypothetical protein
MANKHIETSISEKEVAKGSYFSTKQTVSWIKKEIMVISITTRGK